MSTVKPNSGASFMHKRINEECGVFGIWAPNEDVAKMSYYALYALQHRGQEAAGIAVADGESILVFKDLGLVSQVFDEKTLSALRGKIAVAHCRYSTQGDTTWCNAQPTFQQIENKNGVALGHNGNLINIPELIKWAQDLNFNLKTSLTGSDSEVLTAILVNLAKTSDLITAAKQLLPQAAGAYCLVFIDENNLYAARDPYGIRPLALGKLVGGGWVVASETVALDMVGAEYIREVEPGELLKINEFGIKSYKFAPESKKSCVFEHIYLARPDSVIDGSSVYATRVELGKYLAREYPATADVVISVPESGTPAAIGYAQESKLPYAQGLMKNSYIGRTFIQPSQTLRQRGIQLKLNPVKEVIFNKRLVVVDDSIVRGNTQKALVKMLKQAGAREVHVRIASPPVRWPCFYGIDFASSEELIANKIGLDVDLQTMLEMVCNNIGADSLGYISLSAMIHATRQSEASLCMACFSGKYPITKPKINQAVLANDKVFI